ncbi:hypothetical protein ACFVVX_02920 [Kitasatospora sp. NPDC058170]|uniref:hypothetical protein n=1 Tax=Kitasatospora sp. NPDC058170 TaxID=3346364 RepID=UPI0036DABD6A
MRHSPEVPEWNSKTRVGEEGARPPRKTGDHLSVVHADVKVSTGIEVKPKAVPGILCCLHSPLVILLADDGDCVVNVASKGGSWARADERRAFSRHRDGVALDVEEV